MSIPLFRPFVNKEVSAAVNDVFKSRWLGYGPKAMELEKRFADKWSGFAVATNSCTSALFLVAKALFETKEDEAIVPAITFVSTGMAFYNAGFKVVIADIDENGLMDINSAKKLINKNTKVIVPVHLYGQKIDLKEYRKLCDEKGIYLVEDCAHRIGYHDEKRYGHFACFSFNAMKELPSGEGGALWGEDMSFEKTIRAFANVGLKQNTVERVSTTKHSNYMFSDNTGLKYLQNDIIAAMTLAQFNSYDSNIQKRKAIFNKYNAVLSKKEYAKLIQRSEDDSYLMYVVRIKKDFVEAFRNHLSKYEIATSHHYPSLANHPLFTKKIPCPIAEEIQYELVTLPCFIELSEEEQEMVVKAIDSFKE